MFVNKLKAFSKLCYVCVSTSIVSISVDRMMSINIDSKVSINIECIRVLLMCVWVLVWIVFEC